MEQIFDLLDLIKDEIVISVREAFRASIINLSVRYRKCLKKIHKFTFTWIEIVRIRLEKIILRVGSCQSFFDCRHHLSMMKFWRAFLLVICYYISKFLSQSTFAIEISGYTSWLRSKAKLGSGTRRLWKEQKSNYKNDSSKARLGGNLAKSDK